MCSIEGREDIQGAGRTKKDAKAESAKWAFQAVLNGLYAEPSKNIP